MFKLLGKLGKLTSRILIGKVSKERKQKMLDLFLAVVSKIEVEATTDSVQVNFRRKI